MPVPVSIIVDHGSEFTSQALEDWASRRGVELDFIRSGKPMEDGHIESFNGPLRDDCLDSRSSCRSTTREPRSKRGAWIAISGDPTAHWDT